MSSEHNAEMVEHIILLANTQIELVTKAQARPEHTALVLNEIIERAIGIKPGKRFIGADQIDDQLKKFVEGAVGFCAATREEEHSVWSHMVDQREPPVAWRQRGGVGVTVGYLDERPVHVALNHVDVAGHKVIFYNATSTVVDHDMVKEFINLLAPDSARDGDRVNHADATNMSNILPRDWQGKV